MLLSEVLCCDRIEYDVSYVASPQIQLAPIHHRYKNIIQFEHFQVQNGLNSTSGLKLSNNIKTAVRQQQKNDLRNIGETKMQTFSARIFRAHSNAIRIKPVQRITEAPFTEEIHRQLRTRFRETYISQAYAWYVKLPLPIQCKSILLMYEIKMFQATLDARQLTDIDRFEKSWQNDRLFAGAVFTSTNSHGRLERRLR